MIVRVHATRSHSRQQPRVCVPMTLATPPFVLQRSRQPIVLITCEHSLFCEYTSLFRFVRCLSLQKGGKIPSGIQEDLMQLIHNIMQQCPTLSVIITYATLCDGYVVTMKSTRKKGTQKFRRLPLPCIVLIFRPNTYALITQTVTEF
jgi:hypothetical protein